MKRSIYWPFLPVIILVVFAGLLAAADRGKTIVPRPNDPIPKTEVMKLTGDAFWTYTSGKGRVVGTTTGHYTYTFHDPIYRLLLMRSIAWALDENPAPFMPLVFHGITDDQGKVGTTDTMLDYTNRKN